MAAGRTEPAVAVDAPNSPAEPDAWPGVSGAGRMKTALTGNLSRA